MTDVIGYCPMGCGQTLFLGSGGHVTCSYLECPNPASVDELLSESDTRHLVRIEGDKFTIQHPLRERLTRDGGDFISGSLFACELHQRLHALDGPPAVPGYYHATIVDDKIVWEVADPPTQ